MRERPILFSGPMVLALLNGRKTQTRRVLEPQECVEELSECIIAHRSCPYGEPGDRLWVRETWAHVPITAYRCSEGVQQTANPNDPDMAAVYGAGWDHSCPGRWRPSIHMPRWASRLTLEITAVRVERLQDISEADAKAEGADIQKECKGGQWIICGPRIGSYREGFRWIWEKINGPGSWAKNPWVWVLTFNVIGGVR